MACSGAFGVPDTTRTCDPGLRRLVLYPTELLGHISKIFNFSAQTDSNELPLRRRQTVNLVLDTIRPAMKKEKKRVAAGLCLHSGQGFQYAPQAYFNLTQAYGITLSMSRKGKPYDNAMAENLFSILKTECIYRRKPAAFSEANERIDRYSCH